MLQNHPVPNLFRPRLVSLRRLIPRGSRLIVSLGAAAASAVRMIHSIHRGPAYIRANAQVTAAPGVSKHPVFMVDIADLAYGRHAFAEKLSYFARWHTHLGESSLFRHELCGSAGGTNKAGAGSRNQLNIVKRCPIRNPIKRQSVSNFDVRFWTGLHHVAHFQAFRLNDVTLLAIHVKNKSKASAAVRFVLECRHFAGNTELVTFKIDLPIGALVTAALMAYNQKSPIVSATLLPHAAC